MTRFNPWARRRARRSLVQAIYQWQMTGQTPLEIETQFAEDAHFKRIDAEFFRAVLGRVARGSADIDAVLATVLDRAPDKLDPVERAILRMAVVELRDHVETPYRVILDESIELARTYGASESHKYVNAVLDRLARSLRAVETGA